MRVSESVAEGVHFRDVIINLTREVSRFLSTDRYYAALYDDTTGQFLEVCHSRLGESYRRAVTSPDSGLPERIAIREKEIVEVPYADEWYGAPEVLKSENVRGAVVFPLLALGRVVGLTSFLLRCASGNDRRRGRLLRHPSATGRRGHIARLGRLHAGRFSPSAPCAFGRRRARR